jgi:hypothetical protein
MTKAVLFMSISNVVSDNAGFAGSTYLDKSPATTLIVSKKVLSPIDSTEVVLIEVIMFPTRV